MTDKQTPTDAATPECLTCSDHGAVGNILTAEPCPDCTRLNAQPAPATQPAPAAQQAGERVYAFRRKGLEDFCTCDEARYEELSNKPHLFETRVFYTAPQPSPTTQAGSGFDYKTAADFLSGKTVSNEALRKFVAASRGAHDARAALHAKMLSLQGELASREAEIALLKRSLLDAEADAAAPQPPTAPATQQAGATKEHVRLVRVIADKIEDGTLFRSGIYSNKDLARFVRNVADAAAPQFPTTQAQADNVQEDAARYRLLRRGQHWSVIDGIGNDLRAEVLDAAVDAARKQGGV